MEKETFVYTACPGWGDHDYCAIKTIIKDGRIERTERVIYSEPEEPDGHICQKGCLAGRQPYDPHRLRKPLKRIGERGSGQFEEISWDQALDEIGQKLCDDDGNFYVWDGAQSKPVTVAPAATLASMCFQVPVKLPAPA